jgi:hypothetical protein
MVPTEILSRRITSPNVVRAGFQLTICGVELLEMRRSTVPVTNTRCRLRGQATLTRVATMDDYLRLRQRGSVERLISLKD